MSVKPNSGIIYFIINYDFSTFLILFLIFVNIYKWNVFLDSLVHCCLMNKNKTYLRAKEKSAISKKRKKKNNNNFLTFIK